MQNLNIDFIKLEQGIKNLITQAQLPITVVESILKNTLYEIKEQKQQYLIQLQQELTQKQEESLQAEEE